MKNRPAFALWPIVPFGGEDDEPAQNAEPNEVQSNPSPKQATQPPASEPEDDGDDAEEYKGYSVAELRRIAADNAKAAKDAAAEAKTFKDKQAAEERKKNDDVTNLTKDVSERDETIASLRSTLAKQAIIGAIRDDTRFEWYDPEMVAQQLDPEVVKVDDNGRVEGIKSSLPKVAKAHPFLLKQDNTPGNSGRQQNNDNGPTGFQPGQGGTSGGSGNETDTKKLAENYPALTARV